jgi:chemotaxis protein methyltransferase CheR
MIGEKEFETIRKIVYDTAGIKLGDSKRSLVTARISSRLRILNISSYEKYLDYLHDAKNNELIELIDVISTNFTHFFREQKHFDFLEKMVRNRVKEGQKRFRIWSCASSTGEEPYSIALTMANVAPQGTDTRILATDISQKVLAHCRRGVYTQDRLKGIPDGMMKRYTQSSGNGERSIKAEVKNLVSFAWLNLSTPPFPMQGPFDCVFCRNVMIYFDTAVRQRLVSEIERLLGKGALFFVGHSESLTGIRHSLKTLAPSIYMKE